MGYKSVNQSINQTNKQINKGSTVLKRCSTASEQHGYQPESVLDVITFKKKMFFIPEIC